jgi:hypothetical protein
VPLKDGRDDAPTGDDDIRGADGGERLPVGRVRKRAPEVEIARHRIGVVEADIARPRGAAEPDVGMERLRHQVCELRRVANEHQVELALLVGTQSLCELGADKLDLSDVPGAIGAPPQDEPIVGPVGELECAADDACLGGAIDRMPWLRPAVGTIHCAHEVRRRRTEPELDRPVVERPHTDRVPVGVAAEVGVLTVLEREVDGY